LQFSLQAASPGTFGYTLILRVYILPYTDVKYVSVIVKEVVMYHKNGG